MMNCSPSGLDFDLSFGGYLLVKFQLSCVSEVGNCSNVRSVPVGQRGRMSGVSCELPSACHTNTF
jgi:hypothetical protein